MAKKKKKKTAIPLRAVGLNESGTVESNLLEVHTELLSQHTKMFAIWKGRDDETSARIDRIVDAISRAKSVKGM